MKEFNNILKEVNMNSLNYMIQFNNTVKESLLKIKAKEETKVK